MIIFERILIMKRILAFILCAGIFAAVAAGCGGTQKSAVATEDEAYKSTYTLKKNVNDYDDTLKGLCQYFGALGYINPIDKNQDITYSDMKGELIGAIELSDTVREESKSVISKLKKLGIAKTVMLTGDKKSAAHSVAKKLGIDTYHSELLPDKKLEIINDLKREGHTVCFVGDGINDAPVLSASNCGAAMGLGSEAAIESSDMVLSSGNLTQLPKAVKIARSVMRTIKGNILFALAVKALVIILACLGLAAIWMSVIADTGVCVICVLISARLLKKKY